MFCSSGKTEGLNRKDKLYNKLVEKFTAEKLDFPKSTIKSEGSYFIQVSKEYYLIVLRDICTIISLEILYYKTNLYIEIYIHVPIIFKAFFFLIWKMCVRQEETFSNALVYVLPVLIKLYFC